MMMMNPASSGSDDDSSSGNSSAGSDELRRLQRRADIEPVDSDDDDVSSDDGDINNDVTNFDDLPTDDSEDESDSDDDSSSDNGGGANNAKQQQQNSDSENSSSEEEESVNEEEDVPLSERVESKARVGRRYYTEKDNQNDNDHVFDDSGKKQRAERKSRAIVLASERLREARSKSKVGKNKKSKQTSKQDESDDDDSSIEEQATSHNDEETTTKKKKKSKHAPTEMSSKRRDYFARGRPDLNSSGIGVSIGANKYKARDPRMISLSGHLDTDVFEKRYAFLNEVQDKEIEQLKIRINAWKTSGKKGQRARRKLGITQGGGTSLEEDQEEVTRLLQECAERKRANVVRTAKKSVKQQIHQDVASGKRAAYYPKRSELKRMEAEAKYTEIRKRGGEEAVNKAISKRRKKNMSKEAKSMPSHMIS